VYFVILSAGACSAAGIEGPAFLLLGNDLPTANQPLRKVALRNKDVVALLTVPILRDDQIEMRVSRRTYCEVSAQRSSQAQAYIARPHALK
jgi:hypothetical protein